MTKICNLINVKVSSLKDINCAVRNFKNHYGRNPSKLIITKQQIQDLLNSEHVKEELRCFSIAPKQIISKTEELNQALIRQSLIEMDIREDEFQVPEPREKYIAKDILTTGYVYQYPDFLICRNS